MRIDRYLKLARLIKRRTAAQEMASVGAVRINGRQCKPSSEVRAGDVVEIAYPSRILTVEVLCDGENELKRCAPGEAYSVREERRADPEEKPW
ncbi:S4 domain-containing protein [Aminivibrio sp.]|jgi:ribosomal 50S subunit-recycling heat shock protein|uniref:S4 domain-containing protein n=1 Tax=Aminivibrio sp. TaxID=1872489 RepID=UPI00169D4215|nr:RNA-binding S4 domain-containing protein [Synergistaceae bacterium]